MEDSLTASELAQLEYHTICTVVCKINHCKEMLVVCSVLEICSRVFKFSRPFPKGSKRFKKFPKQTNKQTQFKTSDDCIKRETICNVLFLEKNIFMLESDATKNIQNVFSVSI